MNINKEFNIRYSRLATLPEIGPEGVAILQKSKVLIVGCGALGSLSAMYLAASGVGHIGIADFDSIDLSNLQRQIFYSENTLGKSKVYCLKDRINSLNSDIHIEIYEELITIDKARKLFPAYDMIIDGSDNPSTKITIDRVCNELHIPCSIGGVKGFEGQVMTIIPDSIRYEQIFQPDEVSDSFLPCSLAGVLGPAAGMVASLQAAECIKLLTGCGELITNKLFVINLLTLDIHIISL